MNKLLLALGSLCLFFSSCNPKFYSPNTQNVPLLSERGETSLVLSGNENQVEFQGAYAVTNGFAVQANAGLFIPAEMDNGNGGSGKFLEVGGGYFRPVNKRFVFEGYGLLGFGSIENHLPSTTYNNPQTEGDISANVLRYGVQANFGYKSKYFSAAVSSRFVNLNYNNIEGDLIYDNRNQTDYLKDNNNNFLIEPAITIRGGFEKIKLQLQVGYSINISNSSFRQDDVYSTLGLNFNFR